MEGSEVKQLIERARRRLADFERLKQAGLIPLDGDFFPEGVHYPPITMYSLTTEEAFFETFTLPPDGKIDVYVHIPFCRRRCVFCHYPCHYGAPDSEKDQYLDALEKEMDLYIRRLGITKIKIRSILLGGGTPTDLTPNQLKRFLDYFTARCDMSECQQFNYDVDPCTLIGPDGLERLQIMRAYGVDRLTIGIQSFDDKILKKMNRAHDAKEALESIENSRELGYQINIEFIFGYPGQTLENWIDVVEKAIATDVDEIQFYRLKVIPYGDQKGTIQKVRQIRPEEVPDPETAILQKQIAIDMLADKGYKENLRRVFTRKKSLISKYAFNQCCNLLDEMGLGQTAFSSLHDRFGLNTQYFDEYYNNIENGKLPLNRGIVRSKEQQARWAVILPLKNYFLRKKLFEEATGMPFNGIFHKKFETLKEFNLVTEDVHKVQLTELGAFFADEVVGQFSQREFIPFPEENYADGPLNPYKTCESFCATV